MKHTVLIMKPDAVRSEESSKSDWILRVHVETSSPDDSPQNETEGYAAIAAADEWIKAEFYPDNPGDFDAAEWEPVAIYAGHLFDNLTP
jgi:hypothetical protein